MRANLWTSEDLDVLVSKVETARSSIVSIDDIIGVRHFRILERPKWVRVSSFETAEPVSFNVGLEWTVRTRITDKITTSTTGELYYDDVFHDITGVNDGITVFSDFYSTTDDRNSIAVIDLDRGMNVTSSFIIKSVNYLDLFWDGTHFLPGAQIVMGMLFDSSYQNIAYRAVRLVNGSVEKAIDFTTSTPYSTDMGARYSGTWTDGDMVYFGTIVNSQYVIGRFDFTGSGEVYTLSASPSPSDVIDGVLVVDGEIYVASLELLVKLDGNFNPVKGITASYSRYISVFDVGDGIIMAGDVGIVKLDYDLNFVKGVRPKPVFSGDIGDGYFEAVAVMGDTIFAHVLYQPLDNSGKKQVVAALDKDLNVIWAYEIDYPDPSLLIDSSHLFPADGGDYLMLAIVQADLAWTTSSFHIVPVPVDGSIRVLNPREFDLEFLPLTASDIGYSTFTPSVSPTTAFTFVDATQDTATEQVVV